MANAEYVVLFKLDNGEHTMVHVPLSGGPAIGKADACLIAAERLSISDQRKIISVRVVNVNDMDEVPLSNDSHF